MRAMLNRAVYMVFISILYVLPANSFTLSSTVEAITIPAVGGSFQTITFENSYTSAVPSCIYNLPSATASPAVVRIQSVGSSSMQVRLQEPRNSSAVTSGSVFCLVVEEGVNTLPDGRLIEARTVLSTVTHGRNVPLGNGAGTMQNVSGLFSGFTNPLVLGQVTTFNDSDFSFFHANDCENSSNPPYLSNFADGICVTKMVAEDTTTRGNETLGIIVIESGSGNYEGISYTAALGANTIDGVDNGGASYGLGGAFEFATATLSGLNGNNGGWAVFLGAGAVGGMTLSLAIDEDQLQDAERAHIEENVAYFAVRRLPVFIATKTVDRTEIAETLTLNYEILLENTGQLDQTGVILDDTLPDGSTGAVSGPTESLAVDNIFEVGETWTYTVSYSVTAGDISAAVDLINNVSATTDQYTSESQADETALATTAIVPGNPSITITKTADTDINVPAGVTVTYTYVVINTGNQFVSNITLADAHTGSGPAPVPTNETLTADNNVINDSMDASVDGSWDSLAPGDEVTFTATYIITQNDMDTLQ